MRWKTAIRPPFPLLPGMFAQSSAYMARESDVFISVRLTNLQVIKMAPDGTSQPSREWSAQVRPQKMEIKEILFRKTDSSWGDGSVSDTLASKAREPEVSP